VRWLCTNDYLHRALHYITFIHSFTDPLSVKTELDIELVMIEAGLRHAIKSMQYNTTVVEINKTQ
jgi:hypothetical protein